MGSLSAVAIRCGVTLERLLQSSLLCIALHDIGKLTRNFQRMMRATNASELRYARLCNYRHEVAGLWVVWDAARALCDPKNLGPVPGGGLMEALAVAGHHRFLSERYLFDRSHFLNPIQWEPDPTTAIEAAVGLAKEMFRAWGWKLRRYPRQPSLVGRMVGQDNPEEPFDCLLFLKGRVSGEAASDSLRAESYRELFTLLKGLLMTADWMASGAQDCNELADTSLGVVQGWAE